MEHPPDLPTPHEQDPDRFEPYTYHDIPREWRQSLAMTTELWASLIGNQSLNALLDLDIATRAHLLDVYHEPPQLSPQQRDTFKRALGQGMNLRLQRFTSISTMFITNTAMNVDHILLDAARAIQAPNLTEQQICYLLFPLNYSTASPKNQALVGIRQDQAPSFTYVKVDNFSLALFGGQLPEHLSFLASPLGDLPR